MELILVKSDIPVPTKHVSSEEWACQLCHSKIWRIKSDKDKDKREIDFQYWDYRFRKICDGSLKRNGNNDLHFSTNAPYFHLDQPEQSRVISD